MWLETVCRGSCRSRRCSSCPVEVWLGQYDGAELLGVFAHQAAWVAVLVLAGRRVMSRAVRRVVVQGG